MTQVRTEPPISAPEAPQPPPGVDWMASEAVLLLRAALPPLSTGQRRAAIAFAVEDRIAQPIESVNVVLGPLLEGEYLVAVAARDDIASNRAERPASKARLVPDVLALPRPSQGWAVWVGGARALVRLADGTGFATSLMTLPLIWHHAGKPEVALCAGQVPDGIPVTSHMPLPRFDPAFARLDLAAGAEASGLLHLPRGGLALVAVLVLAAGLHLGLIWADLANERHILTQREADLRIALNNLKQKDSGDLDADLVAAMAAAQPKAQTGFLPLMAESSAALVEVPGLSVQAMTWGDGALRLDLQALDLSGLQAAEAALTSAGIVVRVGSATSSDGAAKVEMTLQGGQK